MARADSRNPAPRLMGSTYPHPPGRGTFITTRRSGRPAADQPDGRGDEQHRQREQPAALDPLERPELTGRMVAGPLRVAVRSEATRNGFRLRLAARSHRARGARWAEPVEEAVGGKPGEGELAALGPP